MGEAAPIINFASPEDRERYERSRSRRGRSGPRDDAGDPVASTLPHSLEAEEFLLSACALDGGETVGAAYGKGVRAWSFYGAGCGDVWAAFETLWHEKRPCEVVFVAEELKARGRFEELGGYAFLARVTGRVPTTAHAAEWIERVLDYAWRRQVIRAADSAKRLAQADAPEAASLRLKAPLDELQQLRTTCDRDLPAMMSAGQFAAANYPVPMQLIEGVMHIGRRTLLLAPSKASKTFTTLHMALCIAMGLPWLGFKTNRARVLVVDLELPTWGLKARVLKLCEILEVRMEDLDVEFWSLDGYQRSIDELLPLITARAPLGKFGLITIEPAYVILGKRDENDNADVTDFMNRLAWLARLTGAAVLCTHHFAKGDASKKETKDRGSGAGAWVRAPDTAITITPLDEGQGEDCYSMEFIERNMKRHAPVGVQFEYPVFKCKSGLDLNALREPGRPRESTEKDVVRALGDDALTHGQWMKACRVGESGQMSERTFNRRIKEAEEAGLVARVGPLYKKAGGAAAT